MKTRLSLVMKKRHADVHVQLEGNPAVWGCGENAAEAIRDWIFSHGQDYGIQVAWDISDAPTARHFYEGAPRGASEGASQGAPEGASHARVTE